MINRDYDYFIELDNGVRYLISTNKLQENWIGYCQQISTDAQLDRSQSNLAFDDGAIVSELANVGSRTLTFEIFVPEEDPAARAIVSHRALEMNASLKNNPGKLIWRESDGLEREWGPIFLSSLIHIDTNDNGPTMKYLISLVSGNPFAEWTQSLSFTGLKPSEDKQDLAPNFGNCYAFPEMTIYGPCNSFKVENYYTGEYLEIVKTIGASDYVKIYTDPHKRDVQLNGNSSIFPNLSFQIQGTAPSNTHNTEDSYIGYNADYIQFQSTFWAFNPKKDASIVFTATGSNSNTEMDIIYKPSWLY